MKYLLILIPILVACQPSNDSKNEEQNDEKDTVNVTAVTTAEEVQTPVVQHITTDELQEMLNTEENYQLVDVRTPGEVDAGVIEGAITGMDFLSGEFQSKYNELDKEKPVIVYCAAGGRSAKAATILAQNGFKKVYNYQDGYNGWSKDN